MASYTIGPKIGLDGEADFRKSLNNINNTLRTLDSELKKTASEFGENADSEDALKAKNDVLNRSIAQQEKKLVEVKKALEYSKKEYGENADQTQKWQRVVNNTETDLNNLKNQVSKNEKALKEMADAANKNDNALDDMGDAADKAADKTEKLQKVANGVGTVFKGIGTGVAAGVGAIAAGVSAIDNITESTREYREDMGKLETAFETAGISQEAATETYKSFYSVLGEEDRSVEAVNHLAKLTQSQEDLEKWTDICAGVWGTFGDSLPIEGLTEAANETAKVGQVTGPLADALNWAGVSEDAFNEKLAACSSEQERAALITNTLNGLYKEAAENYKAANGEIMNAQRAQSELTDATAKLGEALEPVSTSFKYLGADIINDIAPGVEAIGEGLTGIFDGSEDAGKKLGEGVTSVIESLLDNIEEMLPIITSILVTVIPSLLESVIEALPEIGALGVDILLALATGLINNLPSLLQAAIDIIVYLAQSIADALPELIPTIVNVIIKIAEILTDPVNLENLIMAALQIILALATGLIKALPQIIDKVPTIITNIVTAIIKLLPQFITVAVKILTTLASGLTKNVGKLIGVIPKIIKQLISTFTSSNTMSQARQWGRDFIQNIIDGIRAMISRVRDAVRSVANTIRSYLHFSVPDEGPLVDTPKWMPDMIDLLVDGMKKNEYRLGNAARSLASTLNDEMTISASVKNFGENYSNVTVLNPIYLDGKLISLNTEKQVTQKQTAKQLAKGVVTVNV